MTSVSVALCSHNGARFIREQIRSICGQSLSVSEIVLSDDASRDGCVEQAKLAFDECLLDRPGLAISFRVLRNARVLGVARNFEQAATACEGDLIAFSDQDDVWHAQRLTRMVAEFEKRDELLLLHTDAKLVDEDGQDIHRSLFQALGVRRWEIESIHGGRALDVLLRRNVVPGATTVFRRALLQRAAPFPAGWLHDEWLATLAAVVGCVDVLEEQLIDYRQHDANQIGVPKASSLKQFIRLFAVRGETYTKRVAKAETLLQRVLLENQYRYPEAIEKIGAKLAHEQFRAGLSANRLLRIAPVAREALSGRYDKYGIAKYNVFRDLLERF